MSSTDQNFEIVMDIDGKSHQDINFCCFFRLPVIKQASYCLIRSFLPQVVIKSLNVAINQNNYPDVKLKIYLNHEERNRKNSKLIFYQTLSCINCSTEELIQFDQEKSHATLLLVHPIIHFLGNTNTYNRIHRDKTPYEILQDFEGYLTSNHGDIFDFSHIGSDIEKNEYAYEQILTKPENDLNVPSYLIHNYKINHSFSFYFFDNFFVDTESSKEINCQYINIYDPKKFQQVDIQKWVDSSQFAKFQKEIPLSDYFKTFDKDGHRFILNQQDIRYQHEKEPKQSKVPKKKPGNKIDSSLVNSDEGNRRSKFEQDGKQSENQLSTSKTYSRIYCPDSVENGSRRFEIGNKTFLETIESLDLYEISQCLPDFPQFGNIYNLYLGGNINKYIVTPLNICNIFKRKNMKEQFLYHFSRTLFIRYFRE